MKLDAKTIKKKEKEYYEERSKEEFEDFKNCPLFIREQEQLKRLPNSLSKPFGEEGGWGMHDLVWIAYLKSQSQPHLLKNNKKKVKKIFDEVKKLDENKVEKRVDKLKELKGVGTAVASVILTFMDPERYTVIDQHAVRALKHYNKLEDVDEDIPESGFDSSHYEKYLKICEVLADEILEDDYEYPLRTLDRVLWNIGKEIKNNE